MKFGSRIQALFALLLSLSTIARAQGPRRVLFVTPVDQNGQPVAGLSADDFDVRELGDSCTIVRVDPANEPMRIVLLVDNSTAASRAVVDIRNGVQAFLDGLPADDEVALATIAGQFRVRVQPTSDRQKLKDGASLIFPENGSSPALVDGLVESDRRFLQRTERRWPVFVIVTTDGPQGVGIREEEFNRFARDVVSRGVTAHAFVLFPRQRVALQMAEILARSTGGEYATLAATTGLPDRLRALASRLADDHKRMAETYRVEYTSRLRNPTSEVAVVVNRPGTKVQVAPDRRKQNR